MSMAIIAMTKVYAQDLKGGPMSVLTLCLSNTVIPIFLCCGRHINFLKFFSAESWLVLLSVSNVFSLHLPVPISNTLCEQLSVTKFPMSSVKQCFKSFSL